MPTPPNQLDQLVAEVLAGAKYRAVSPELVRAIGERELATRRSLREAVKETKSRLHQVAGAFLERSPRYVDWLEQLRAASPEQRPALCRGLMANHASTRERLPQLEAFYAAIFAQLPPVNRLLDVACGLNPLAAPWMPLAPGALYFACDLYADMGAFLGAALPLLGVQAETAVCDLSVGAPPWEADVALVLKTLPVLEHLRRGAGQALLRELRAATLVVSFPTRSLGGRNVGMAAAYTGQIQTIAEAEGWPLSTLEFANELVFVMRKQGM
jgi:16S rRNA (guanine(1405)-N(7))-methyltransferase